MAAKHEWNGPNYSFTAGNAKKLAKTIEKSWHDMGYSSVKVKVDKIPTALLPSGRWRFRYDIRSNLVNGNPPLEEVPSVQ